MSYRHLVGSAAASAVLLFPVGGAFADAPSPVSADDVSPGELRLDVAQMSAPTVTVTSPGAEPRRELRYDLAAIQPSGIEMDMAMRMGAMMGMPAQTLPTNRIRMSFPSPEVTERGTLRQPFRMDGIEVLETEGVAPGVAEAMRSAMGQMGTFEGVMEFGPRGDLRAYDMNLDDLAPAARAQIEGMRSSFDQMTVPLPEEAVGVGATWTVQQEVYSQGFRIDQTAAYKLVEMGEEQFRLDVEITQTGPDQAISTPELPAAAGVRGRLSGTASGTMQVRFDSIVPVATVRSTVQMQMSMGEGDQAQQLPEIEMGVDMEIRPQ